MNDNSNHGLPWQKTARNLILYAYRFQKATDEFERQVGYLLLDVGVETLFRVFVTQPGTETKTGYTKRDKIAKGTVDKTNIQKNEISLSAFDELAFHTLVETVKQIAGDKVNKDELNKVEYFHNIRNKIYHLGDGIVPTKENFEEYLGLAQTLLQNLLGVKWEVVKYWEEDVDMMEAAGYSLWVDKKQAWFRDLCYDIAIATALIKPKFATSKFKEELEQLYAEFENVLDDFFNIPPSMYDFATSEFIKKFNNLTDLKIENTKLINFIIEISKDVTILQLAILFKHMGEDTSEIKKYIEFRNYSEEESRGDQPITNDDIKKFEEISTWVNTTQKKINAFIENKISDSKLQ